MTTMPYPDKLEIIPLSRPPHASVDVPGSKSITNRALVLAALCSGERKQELRGCLRSEDTEYMVQALQRLGVEVAADWHQPVPTLTVYRGGQSHVPVAAADLFVGNSGTTMRFLTALLSLGHGRYRIDGVPRMRERPMEDLLAALRQLGVRAYAELDNGCPPVIMEAEGLRGGHVRIKGEVSSQFLSGLLMVAPFAANEVLIEVDGPLVSKPYIDMTLSMMKRWGLGVESDDHRLFRIPGGQTGFCSQYDVEPDASAASYFFAAAAITGGSVSIPLVGKDSIQGDMRFLDVLQAMGCPLHGIDVDMNDISDMVMTLAAVACFADGPTTIRNVAHIRHKETDRLVALATELRRVGAGVDEFADGLTITPRPLHGAEIETYNDHRMAMSMALIGLRVPGIVIKNPACVAKTYPGFFEDLEKLR
jgi:3-phosphoshikimate 1-carboxyvinyltransferase